MEDEDEVDVLGDFCLNLETDLNNYDTGEFPTQNNELLGDYMQHPWLLDNSQVWYFDHSTDDKSKSTLENMLQDEKKHFPSGPPAQNSSTVSAALPVPKVSPIWTKEDIDSLKKGIELFGQNWSKVARTVATKTTLQVKSYVKSRPELLSISSHPSSCTLSPPQFINEVEVAASDDSMTIVTQYTMDEIVNEAEIPASMEEVIASVTTGWPTSQTNSKSVVPRTKPSWKQQNMKRKKEIMPKKKVPGRPKKSPQKTSLPPSENVPIAIPSDTIIPFIKKSIPVLEGEIIRLRKEGGITDSDSDSDVDIGDVDECVSGNDIGPKMEDKRKVDTDSDVKLILCNEPEPQGRNSPLVTHMPLDAVEVTVEVKSSEYDSSEESVGPKDSASNRLVDVESQPVYTFPEPLEEATIDLNGITDEEKTIHWDFFEGRPSKTPERYVKIRNSIVQEWRRVKPRYLTKTSVRPSLKNCGDVNCISRVHAYLELIGAINFGCEQVQYNRPLPPVPSHRERVMAGSSGSQSNSSNNSLLPALMMRARKKRQLSDNERSSDENGGGGGYTIRHDGSIPILSSDSAPLKTKQPRKVKAQSDPFQLVPCISFGADKSAPFRVQLSTQALAVIDVHSHLCTTEVIGLLGGHYCASSDESVATLFVEAAQPCRSLATGHQCEMCPVSQTEGSEELRSRGLEIVGWYHSHPTFPALPSIRDLHTQSEFQQWFSKQDAPFIGIIVNPFSTSGIKSSMSLKSIIRCITVHDDLPYKHDLTITSSTDLDEMKSTLDFLGRGLDLCPTLVPLSSAYPYLPSRAENSINYAKKAIFSVRAHLEKVLEPTALKRIEEMAEEFFKQLMALRLDNVTVSATDATPLSS